MKNIYYYLIVALIPVFLFSCLKEEKDIFEDSAANRMTKALKEYNDVLISAPNGWHMAYYIGRPGYREGGFNLLCKFEQNGNVTIASEEAIGEEITSLYKLNSDQAATLSFDTYNIFIHKFGEPQGGPITDEGDYEFIFDKVTSDEIILTGKKYRNKIVLTRFDENKDWKEYLTEVNKIIETTQAYSTYKLMVDGIEIGQGSVDPEWERLFSFYIPVDNTEEVPEVIFEQNAIYTPDGIQFYEPVEVGGKTILNFRWDEAERTYISTDGVDVKFVVYKSPTYYFYEEFIGTYTLYHANHLGTQYTKTVTIEPLVEGLSYKVTGFVPPFEIEMQYIKTLGALNLVPQLMGEDNLGQPVYLYPYIGTGTDFYPTITNGAFKGTFNGSEEDPKIEFTINTSGNTLGNGLGGFISVIVRANGSYGLFATETVYKSMYMVRN